MSRVCVDPGHGGRDPGAVGNGLRESDVVLKIGQYLNQALSGYNCEVRMTRNSDVFVSLTERANIANRFRADLYISLHINSATITAHGFESFVAGTLPPGHQTRKWRLIVHRQIMEFLSIHGIRDRGRKNDTAITPNGFTVLRRTNMSAMLMEYLFISNPDEAALLRKDDFLRGIANSTAIGIARALNLSGSAPELIGGDEMEELAIVTNKEVDAVNVYALAKRVGCGVFPREVAEKRQVAKKIIVAGGGTDGLKGDRFDDLSGDDRWFTAGNVGEEFRKRGEK